MHSPARYRSPYRRNLREVHTQSPDRDIRERFIIQGIVCGVILAALMAAVLTGLPFTESIRTYAANQLRVDYTDDLPLDPIIRAFEQARYFVFGDTSEAAAPTEYIPDQSASDQPLNTTPILSAPTPPPQPPATGMGQALSYEDNEHNTFYELGDEERLFIEDIIRQIHESGDQYRNENTSQQENEASDEHLEHSQHNFGAHALAPAIPPGEARISSPFGYRTNPITGQAEKHNGVDMAFAHGTPVVAIQDGVVTEIGYNTFSGNYVRYKTSDGLLVGYAHLYRVLVQTGDILSQGDVVALTGNSGLSTGPHLHVTIWQDGETIDPLAIFAAN